jgi:hypothetical protein
MYFIHFPLTVPCSRHLSGSIQTSFQLFFAHLAYLCQ